MATPTSISPTSRNLAISDYPRWLASHDVNVDLHQRHFEYVAKEFSSTVVRSSFWAQVQRALRDVDAQYQITNAYPLISISEPNVVLKPWSSFLEKTYRKNVLNNPAFPMPPEEGWYVPSNWFERIHDIVRTTIEVKYLDGVDLILRSLKSVADKEGLRASSDLEARVDGYYGAHFNCEFSCSVPDLAWKMYEQSFTLEVQVTTSMKEVIKKLLHTFYETSRTQAGSSSRSDISWNYSSNQFNAAYLSHILHYVEGMIIEVRKQQRKA